MSETEIFSSMIGSVMTRVDGGIVDSDRMTFIRNDGVTFSFFHWQNCCERVSIEDIVGDIGDLIGFPIVEASETSSKGPNDFESSTWTFYRFSTVKGTVTVRWLGTSNGYYSERVSFEMKPECGHASCVEDECVINKVMTE